MAAGLREDGEEHEPTRRVTVTLSESALEVQESLMRRDDDSVCRVLHPPQPALSLELAVFLQ